MDPTRFTDMIPGCYDPVERAKDMLADGIRASVCFPTLPRFAGVLFPSQGQGARRPVRPGLQRLRDRRVVRVGARACSSR